jgi:hypothetical protein
VYYTLVKLKYAFGFRNKCGSFDGSKSVCLILKVQKWGPNSHNSTINVCLYCLSTDHFDVLIKLTPHEQSVAIED